MIIWDSRSFHQAIHERSCQTGGAHSRCQGDEEVDSLVEFWVYTEGGESLSGALAESDIAEALCVSEVEDVLDRVGDITPGKVVDAEVPEFGGVWVVVNRFLRVLVASVVTQPNVEAQFGENEGKRALGVCEAYPDFGIHEKTMVEVYDRLVGSYTRERRGLAFACRKTMKTETVSVLGKDDMVLVVVAEDSTELLKVLSLSDFVCDTTFCRAGCWCTCDSMEDEL